MINIKKKNHESVCHRSIYREYSAAAVVSGTARKRWLPWYGISLRIGANFMRPETVPEHT